MLTRASEPNRQVSQEEGQLLAREWECPFVECSAKDNDNISTTLMSGSGVCISELTTISFLLVQMKCSHI
jgi:hypothetical protein